MDPKELDDKIGKLGKRVNEIGTEMTDLLKSDSAESKARLDELKTEQGRIRQEVTPLLAAKKEADAKAALEAQQKDIDDLKAMFSGVRAGSKAKLIGNPKIGGMDRDAQAGAFIGAIMGLKTGDPEVYAASKATLLELGSTWSDVPAESKATLGSTDAAGGWILPNALVDDLIKPAGYTDPFGALCTDVRGVTVGSIDIPVRNSRPSRATVQPFGETKENKDLAYDGYTATIYTLARIYDLGLQFARRSQGAAERDVVEELGTAFQLGTEYYTVSGSGSSEPYGLVTALAAGVGTPFTSSFTASATTLAGSILKAIATAGGELAGRGRGRNLSAVVNAAQYWLLVSQGTDNAGFFYSGIGGAAAIPNVAQGTLVTPFGVPVVPDDSFPTDDLVVGQFAALKRYFGQAYRVDSSTEAGDRWDKNLIGFRGEMEFGIDARPAVVAGAFQYVADITP